MLLRRRQSHCGPWLDRLYASFRDITSSSTDHGKRFVLHHMAGDPPFNRILDRGHRCWILHIVDPLHSMHRTFIGAHGLLTKSFTISEILRAINGGWKGI